MSNNSKKLGHDDESGFDFSQEMLAGDATCAINFDRLQKHPSLGYIIFEYLLCEETQYVTPYTSHPSRYWNKNSNKFLALWRAALEFNATLYLVNYAKKGTKFEDEVLLIKVLDMDEYGINSEEKTTFTRESFKQWFRVLNAECLTDKNNILKDIYKYKSVDELGKTMIKKGKYAGNYIKSIYEKDVDYLYWLSKQEYPCSECSRIFLNKMIHWD